MKNLSFNELLLQKIELLKNKSILVAFSGGKDSVALLDFLNCFKKKYFYQLTACHVNHGLRKSAINDENFCKEFCKKNNINFEIVNISDKIQNDLSSGIENAARKYRYEALQIVSNKLMCDYILTAHTFDDQIETFFTDIYTGASIFTLGGIREKNGSILRLMLDISTEKIYSYLSERNINYIEDDSNSDIRFIRNRVRHNLIPNLYNMGSDFVSTVLRLQDESSKLNDFFYNITKKSIIYDSLSMTVIDKKIFLSYDDILKEYLLGKVFSKKFRFTKSVVQEALKILYANKSLRIDLPLGYCFEVSFDKIRVFKKDLLEIFSIEKPAGIGSIITSKFKFIFKDEFIKKSFTIRNRCKGDKLFNGKKLKDIYNNKKIDLYNRDVSIVIANGSTVLWSECLSVNKEFIIFERIIDE